MALLNINGISVQANDMHIARGRVVIDGRDVTDEMAIGGACGILEIRILEGVLGSLTTDAAVNCGNVQGNVQSGGSLNCGNVAGNAKAGGSLNCGSVGGSVKAGGSVRHG